MDPSSHRFTARVGLAALALCTLSITACDGSDSSAPLPIVIADRDIVALSSGIVMRDGKPELELKYEGEKLSEHGHMVEHQLTDVDEYRISIPDFTFDNKAFQMSVMTIEDDGTLEAWSRDDGLSMSPLLFRPDEGTETVHFVVLAIEQKGNKVLADSYPGILNRTMLAAPDDDDNGGNVGPVRQPIATPPPPPTTSSDGG